MINKCLLINKANIKYNILNKDLTTFSNTVETEVLYFDFCSDYSCNCSHIVLYSCNNYCKNCFNKCCNNFYYSFNYDYIYNNDYCFKNNNNLTLYDVKIKISINKDMFLLNNEININNKLKYIDESLEYYIPFINPLSRVSISLKKLK